MDLVQELISEGSFDLILTSPLDRALFVAKVISNALEKPLIVRNELMERCFGIFQGTIADRIIKDHPNYHDVDWLPSGGESRNEHRQRVNKLMEKIVEYYQDKTILIICHGGTIVRAWEYFQLPYFKPSNASISEIEIVNGVARLIRQNDISHLKGGGKDVSHARVFKRTT